MKSITAITATTLLAVSIPADAAQDMGLSFNSGPSRSSASGVGAQASVTIRLGDQRSVRAADKMVLGVAAGPILSMADRHAVLGVRQSAPALAGLAIRPGYWAKLSLAGRPLLTSYTRMGAAEEGQNRQEGDQPKEKKKQGAGDKAAWVALVAGGVMVALVGVAVLHCSSGACSD